MLRAIIPCQPKAYVLDVMYMCATSVWKQAQLLDAYGNSGLLRTQYAADAYGYVLYPSAEAVEADYDAQRSYDGEYVHIRYVPTSIFVVSGCDAVVRAIAACPLWAKHVVCTVSS